MKRAALVLAVLVCACAATPTPSRDELAWALRPFGAEPATPADITHIACRPLAADPTEFACRWRQRDGWRWDGWQSYLAYSGDGWQLIGGPKRRP